MTMKRIGIIIAFLIACALPARSQAGIYGESFGKCLVSNSSEQDKQQLVEWIFTAISLNPTIRSYVNIPASKREEIDKRMAAIFQRLIGETCRKEAAEALKYEGASSFGVAFQLFGQVAGQQIFAAPEVSQGSMGFLKYINQEDLQKKLGLPNTKP